MPNHIKKKIFSLAKLAEVVKNRGGRNQNLLNLSHGIFFGAQFNSPGCFLVFFTIPEGMGPQNGFPGSYNLGHTMSHWDSDYRPEN